MNAKTHELRMIPVERIDVLNSRERDPAVFKEISQSIVDVGLKKPITVTPRPGADNVERFLLICGEGRLIAYREAGEERIPALVVHVNDDDALIMGLAENIARRKYRPLERLSGIVQLRERGLSAAEIAGKTGLSPNYMNCMFVLLDHGEARLLAAVERGSISLNAAFLIVRAGDDKATQRALLDAYSSGQLRSRELMVARRLAQTRREFGTALPVPPSHKRKEGPTGSSLIQAYRKEVERQQDLVRKADFTRERLLVVVHGLRTLMADRSFGELLAAEGLATLPHSLAARISRLEVEDGDQTRIPSQAASVALRQRSAGPPLQEVVP